jgi:hypothetical protein
LAKNCSEIVQIRCGRHLESPGRLTEFKDDAISDCVELVASNGNQIVWRKDEYGSVDLVEGRQQRLEGRLPDRKNP